MARYYQRTAIGFLTVILAMGLAIPSIGTPLIYNTWREKYLPASPELKKKLDTLTSKCGICHRGCDKASYTAYGRAIHRRLDYKNIDDGAKILEALECAENERIDPNDHNSPTFGELLWSGQLPASD